MVNYQKIKNESISYNSPPPQPFFDAEDDILEESQKARTNFNDEIEEIIRLTGLDVPDMTDSSNANTASIATDRIDPNIGLMQILQQRLLRLQRQIKNVIDFSYSNVS